MLVKLLSIFEYDESGRICKEACVEDPTWEQIEASARRLDKFRFPFVWLFLSKGTTEERIPEFEIVGGNGDYCIACSISGYHERRYCDPTLGNEEIDLWTSDQGASAPAKHVLHDIAIVLEVAKYFCDEGDFCPSIPWEDPLPPRK